MCHSSLPQRHLEIALCPNESCASLYHLTCLASRFDDTDSILPVKGTCPGCRKDILWGDVIRGVFGLSGLMEPKNLDDYDHMEGMDDIEDEEEDGPRALRNEPVSGLLRSTVKQKGVQKTPPKKSRGKGTLSTSNIVDVVPVSDDDATPKPARQRRPRSGTMSKTSTDSRIKERKT